MIDKLTGDNRISISVAGIEVPPGLDEFVPKIVGKSGYGRSAKKFHLRVTAHAQRRIRERLPHINSYKHFATLAAPALLKVWAKRCRYGNPHYCESIHNGVVFIFDISSYPATVITVFRPADKKREAG